MVAVLFRTLDAFRIYDAAFIITRGANNTETVSILGYNQLVNRLNLGLGSAVVDPDLHLRDARSRSSSSGSWARARRRR